MPGVVIVGAGHAGSQCAASLREAGYKGTVTLISDEAETPYHKPPLSKAFLKDPQAGPQVLRAESFYADHGIELLQRHGVEAIDCAARQIHCTGGLTRTYDHLVLATGTRPRIPDLAGVELKGVFALRSLDDAIRLRNAAAAANGVVIIGGGFIGMEAAFTLAGLGKSVTVVEAAPRILGRAVAPVISKHVHARAEATGVRILTGTMPENIEGDGSVSAVRVSTGELLPADLVVIGIGVIPNTELAEAAGIACDNGILVDARMRTSDPNILAIGDCCNFHHWQADRAVRLESVQNATDQAKQAAKTIMGGEEEYREVPWFWSDQGDMKLQMVGLSFDPDRYLISGNPEENAFAVYHFADDRLIAVDTVNRPADHMLGRKFIEAGFTPPDADILEGPAKLKQLLKDLHRG